MTSEKRTNQKPIIPMMGNAIDGRGGERREARQDLNQAEIRQRQRSILNAMLCCLI